MAAKNSRKKAPKDETKAQKFTRLANFRVNKLLKGLKQLGALGGNAYESTPEQRKAVEKALNDAVERAVGLLNKVPVAANEFKL